ncbi:MAG: monofunctional biosynthetic peptidoglycan transglycosylase [Bacteriovorax sp.]|nr:monofunctional biosynthetic peptidoglycan transglycosylase [Bacteriovorax sp.]
MTNETPLPSSATLPKNRLRRLFKLLLTMTLGFLILSISGVLLYRFVPVPYTPLMAWKSTISLFTNGRIGIEKKWVPIEQIARPMQLAVIKAEDAKFYIHNGFDFEAIEKAMKYNKTHIKQKGASTISQQTAKNVFLWPARSWLRKGMEVYFTVLIEHLWNKKRILEVYLNVIELGPGVYGVEAASQKYFHKNARNLNPAQAALIASVLPNPIKFKINKPTAYILRRQRKIMGRGTITTTAVAKSEIKSKETADETKEFFDIKFDSEDEEDNGAGSNDPTPANE